MSLDVMLCDHAQVADGKLYISGGGIEHFVMSAQASPPYVLSFAAAGVVHVGWNDTNTDQVLTFQMLDQDGQAPLSVEGGPIEVKGESRFRVGRPAHLSPGVEQGVPFAFLIQGLPLAAFGRYELVFALNGTEARRVPLTVQSA